MQIAYGFRLMLHVAEAKHKIQLLVPEVNSLQVGNTDNEILSLTHSLT